MPQVLRLMARYAIHICDFSVGCFMVRSDGNKRKQTVHFEDSNQFGPSKVNMKTGDVEPIPDRHWFWRFYQPWLAAGRPTDGEMMTPCGPLKFAVWAR